MLGQIFLSNEKPPLPLQVETDEPALSQDVASQRRTRLLWTSFGVAVLMLIGVSACTLLPLASHTFAKSAHLVPEIAFNPFLPSLGPGVIRPAGHPIHTGKLHATSLRRALLPGVKHSSNAAATRSAVTRVHMMGRKGRPTMPQNPGMQGAYAQGAQRAAPQPPEDGTIIFYLYCRSKPGTQWYPVSAMKGDGQSKGLISAWLNAPLGKRVFKERLDEAMADSIYESERRLVDMAVEQHRQLKGNKAGLQWGFKILSKDLMAKEAKGEIEEQKIQPVDRSMLTKGGLLNKAKAAADKVFSPSAGASADAQSGGGMPKMPDMPKMPKMPWETAAAAPAAAPGPTLAAPPPQPQAAHGALALPAGWEQVIDPSSGEPYYANRNSGESRWEPPV